jgi:hypothetical protein
MLAEIKQNCLDGVLSKSANPRKMEQTSRIFSYRIPNSLFFGNLEIERRIHAKNDPLVVEKAHNSYSSYIHCQHQGGTMVFGKGLITLWLVLIVTGNRLVAEACDGHGHNSHHLHHDEPENDLMSSDHRHLLSAPDEEYLWSSFEAFKTAGARCKTREPEPEEMEEMNRIVEVWREQRTAYSRIQRIQVPLYMHVLRNSKGQGAVSETQIQDQVDVLNASFGPEIEFLLKETIETVNDEWYRCELGEGEVDMKRELRQGGPESLNIYLCVPGKYFNV